MVPQGFKAVTRAAAALLAGTILLASVGFGATPSPAAEALPQLATALAATSVSGLSSGAYMAGQIEIAHAKDIVGAGIVAGGPFACAETSASRAFPFWPADVAQNAMQALYSCMKTTMGVPDPEDLVARAKECNERGDSSGALAYSNRIQEVWNTHDCHPAKSFVPILVQAPLFIGFFSALRGMANAGLPSFSTGGALWFPDLCVADATYGLPIFSGLTFLLTVEAGADGMGADSPNAGKMKMFMRAMAIGLVPLTASMPTSVFVYWNTSNVFSLAQVMLFKWGPARRFFNLPDASLLRAGAPSSSAASPATPPFSSAASTSRPSPSTWTWATSSSSSTPRRSR